MFCKLFSVKATIAGLAAAVFAVSTAQAQFGSIPFDPGAIETSLQSPGPEGSIPFDPGFPPPDVSDGWCETIIAQYANTPANELAQADAEVTVLCLTNAERAVYGLAPLAWNDALGAAARGHAENAATQQWWVDGADPHTNPQGETPIDRITAAGYCPNPTEYWKVGENVFWGYGDTAPTPNDAVQWWMASDGHRANILDPEYTELGVGVVLGAAAPVEYTNAAIFVQNFGTCL